MGGNAIKSAQRLSKDKFFEYQTELKELFPELTMYFVKAYRQKEDFGDVDVVIKKESHLDIPALVKERITPTEEYDNGPFYSFLYKDAQVDFIFMSDHEYEPACEYFSWNDLGNFIGRVARSVNFKYGHDGLSYEEHLDDHYKISIHVSNDMEKILTFLGYDYARYVKGFDTIDEILEYTASSTRFNTLYFTLEDQSHNDRVRNKKRKMYQNMLKYIIDNNIEAKPKLTVEERLDVFCHAVEYFSGPYGQSFADEVHEAREKYEKYKAFKQKFNGDIVAETTGLSGKSLGMLMRYINDYYKIFPGKLEEIIMGMTPSMITDFIIMMNDSYEAGVICKS